MSTRGSQSSSLKIVTTCAVNAALSAVKCVLAALYGKSSPSVMVCSSTSRVRWSGNDGRAAHICMAVEAENDDRDGEQGAKVPLDQLDTVKRVLLPAGHDLQPSQRYLGLVLGWGMTLRAFAAFAVHHRYQSYQDEFGPAVHCQVRLPQLAELRRWAHDCAASDPLRGTHQPC